jgi:hypothetical protein
MYSSILINILFDGFRRELLSDAWFQLTRFNLTLFSILNVCLIDDSNI